MASPRASSRRRRDLQLSTFLGRPARIVVIIVLLAVILFPLYWLVSNSFKQEQEYYHSPPIMFPTKITGQNFVDIVVNRNLFTGLRNSLLIAVFTTLCTVLFGSLASYALVNGMLPRRMKHLFAWWFLIQKMYPAIVVAVPVFYIIRSLQMMDRVAALVLMNTSFNLPLVILLMVGFFQEAPFEVEEQSMLDGANLLQRFRVAFPGEQLETVTGQLLQTLQQLEPPQHHAGPCPGLDDEAVAPVAGADGPLYEAVMDQQLGHVAYGALAGLEGLREIRGRGAVGRAEQDRSQDAPGHAGQVHRVEDQADLLDEPLRGDARVPALAGPL